MNQRAKEEHAVPKDQVLQLLEDLPNWGPVVTIVLHGGCVFEYKGSFPAGSVARGYYNLQGSGPGFYGHLRLNALHHVAFQDTPHAGRQAHALVFADDSDNPLFKVFLGRDEKGDIWSEQLERYEALRVTAIARRIKSEGDRV